MAKEQYGFFDSTTGDAREYTDAEMSRYGRILARSGVREMGSNLKVETASDGLKVKVLYGTALLRGYYYELADDGLGQYIQALETAASNPRIDRIVVRLDLNTDERTIKLRLLKGTEAVSPAPPELTRTEKIYEIALAQIRIGVGASTLVGSEIRDERNDEAVCGVLHPDVAGMIHTQVRGCIYEKGRQTAKVEATGWTANAQGIYEKTIRLAGTEAGSETQRVRYSITGSQTGKALVAGCRVDADDTLTVLCLAIPPAAFDLSTVLEEVKK